jgi:hypothetical protein
VTKLSFVVSVFSVITSTPGNQQPRPGNHLIVPHHLVERRQHAARFVGDDGALAGYSPRTAPRESIQLKCSAIRR